MSGEQAVPTPQPRWTLMAGGAYDRDGTCVAADVDNSGRFEKLVAAANRSEAVPLPDVEEVIEAWSSSHRRRDERFHAGALDGIRFAFDAIEHGKAER